MSNPEKKLNKNLKTILLAALFAALEFVVTYLISFPIPIIQGAYVNAGDTVLYLGACYIGGIWSALSAGIGSMLADIMLGSAIYAIPTLIIKGTMALVCSWIYRKKSDLLGFFLSSLAGGCIMVAGYFIYECFLVGVATAALSGPLNLLQLACSVVLAVVLSLPIKKIRAAV